MTNPTVIVGAGLAGLVAARALAEAGSPVVVFEAGPGPGGRFATRIAGRSVADHGAQFFTVRSERFRSFVEPFLADDVVFEWCRGFNAVDGYPRFAVRGGMAALGARLAEGLDVRTGHAVRAVRHRDGGGYALDIDRGAPSGGQLSVDADAVVLTAPVPLLLPLLAAGGIALDPAVAAITYHRVLALLVTLDRPSAVPPPGGHQSEDGPFSFISDNHQKGISAEVTLTLHTNHRLSAHHWDDDDADIVARLLAWAEPWLGGANPESVELIRWAHTGPVEPWPDAVAVVAERLLIAGDAFAGPKVEGAYLSGCAAADLLLGSSGLG